MTPLRANRPSKPWRCHPFYTPAGPGHRSGGIVRAHTGRVQPEPESLAESFDSCYAGTPGPRASTAAEYLVGDLAATGLRAGSADAVLCVDAIQFAAQPAAAYRELARILAPGG